MIRHLFTIALLAALTGCVSVSLSSGPGKKAENVRFAAPAAPFKPLLAPSADQAWVSEDTGNTISYISDCNSKVEPPLSQLQAEALDVMENRKTADEKNISYNGREATISTAAGELDGIPVMMRVLTMKKNECNYTLMYSGVVAKFPKEEKAFADFLDGFKAP